MKVLNVDLLERTYETELSELLSIFKEDFMEDLGKIFDGLEANNIEIIAQVAHKIKGSSLIIRDQVLHQIMLNIELNHQDPPKLKSYINSLKEYSPKLIEDLDTYLSKKTG